MIPSARLEQDLTDWLRETAMPHTPDYTDEILEETARIRQRPRWSFLSRWVALPNVPARFSGEGRRTLATAMLLLVLVLILAAVAAFVGSRRAVLPPPFGLAGAGLLVVSQEGDIVVVDPATTVRRSIVSHPAVDRDARWSPDGTRLAFIREPGDGQVVVVTDAAGRTLAISPPFPDIDPDSLTWAPNGREIAITPQGEVRGIAIIDAATGATRDVPVAYDGFEVHWRPPDGRQLLFRTAAPPGGLAVLSIEDGSVVSVPRAAPLRDSIRPLGWTPDGRAVLYQYDDGPDSGKTIVVDLETGAETRLDVTYGHVSNDGTRVAGNDRFGRFCVVAISGGPCDIIAGAVAVDGTHGASVSWSPDDRWIAISVSPVWLVDPSGAVPPRIVADGGPAAWQRTLR
jgi:dipeptidyl aminopeptidase/acylaminoacyl peptidase